MYTPQYQEHELPQRQPSFIGLPPISPGPEFGSAALGISSADFGLSSSDAEYSSSRAVSPPVLGEARQQQQQSSSSPSPHPWISNNGAGAPANSNNPNNNSHQHQHQQHHVHAVSSTVASGSPAAQSPSMNSSNYSTQQQPTSTYRPSQGQSMHMQGGAYAGSQQPHQQGQQQFLQQQQQQQQHGGQAYQNGGQFSNGFQQQAQQQQQQQQQQYAQSGFQNGGQYAANGNGNNPNGFQQQPPQQQQQFSQPGSQYAVQNGNSHGQTLPAAYQQLGSSSAAPRAMPSPSLASNGTFILPPGWKATESHLQQPLSSPRHRGSPSISSLKQQPPPKEAYEIDKETGALSTRSVSPPTHSPTDARQPLQRGESSQNGFAPPKPPFAQQQPGAPGSPMDQYSAQNGYAPPNPRFAQEGQGAPLGRTATNNTQGSDQPESKRNSRVFSSIRNRLGGSASDNVSGDGVSDASVLMDEQGRKTPSGFLGLRGNAQPNGEGRASYDQAGNPERSYFNAPSEKKRFFTRPTGGMGFGSSGQEQHISRPATSESVGGLNGTGGMGSSPPIVGFGPSVPRKNRFSKLTGMLNRDGKTDGQLSQPQGHNFAQGPMGRPSLTGMRPSFQSSHMGPPGGPVGGPVGDGHMDTYNRPRAASAATDTRPSIGEHGRNQSVQGLISPPQMGQINEEDRGRKVSAGNLLSNIFGKRSESRTREQQAANSSPGLGQPQGMMNQGPAPTRPGQPGQFPSFLAHSMGMPGQPPVLPPQGQYAGLAQQVQQSQYHQQTQGQTQSTLGLSSARLGAYLQGGPSPGVSPVTQSSGSPFAMQPPGLLGVETRPGSSQRAGTPQQAVQVPAQQDNQKQGPLSPVGVVHIATAVPIRQVERSPNSNTPGGSGQNSPQDSTRGRSASVVNQIEVRRPLLDSQGRIRSGSSATSQQNNVQPQQAVHIASLQAPVRKPVNPPLSPQGSAHLGPQDNSSIETGNKASSIGQSSQGSPTTRRGSQSLLAAHHSHNASQTTASSSPAPSQEQQVDPPAQTPKVYESLSQGFPEQSSAPSPSVYRPSGPQTTAPPSQQTMQPPPVQWRGPSVSQNGAAQQAQPGQPPAQYTMQGRPPQDMMMTAPPQEQNQDKEGAFSRIIKTSKTFVHEKTSSEKPRGEIKNMSSKLLGAFKKVKQTDPKNPPPPPPPIGPPGGPAWGNEPPPQALQQRPAPPTQTQSAPLPVPTQQVVTEGLQQMPSKAQQLLGQPLNAMYQAPQDVSPPKVRRPSLERVSSQPYLDYQEERQTPGKATPPLSPDHIGTVPVSAAPVPQTAQPPPGRPSISSLPSQQQQQPQQHQQPAPPRPSYESPMAGIAAAANRAKNLKQQIVPHDQQYDPVAIPQAYAPVYAGRTASAPAVQTSAYIQSFTGTPAMQYHPQQLQQQQQWAHPSMMQGMAPGQMSLNGMPAHLTQQGVYQQHPLYQGTPPPMMNSGYPPPQQYMQVQHTTTPPAQGHTPPPGVMVQHQMQYPIAAQQNAQQSGQHSIDQYGQQILPHQGWQQPIVAPFPVPVQHNQTAPQQTPTPPQETGSVHSHQSTPVPSPPAQPPPTTALPAVPAARQQSGSSPDMAPASSPENNGQPQLHQPSPVKPQTSSPPNHDVPRSTFAAQQGVPEQSQLQPSNGELMPQRQTSGASQVSSLTTEPATVKGSPDAQRAQVVQPGQTPVSVHAAAQPASPERQRAPVTLQDEPMPKVDTPLTSPSLDKDDLYGATPRHSAVVAQNQYPIQQAQHQNQHVIVSSPVPQSPATTDDSASKFAGMPAGMLTEPTTTTTSKLEPETAPARSEQQQHFILVDPAPAVSTISPQFATPHPTPTSAASPSQQKQHLLVRSKSPLSAGSEEEPPSPTESELKLPRDGQAAAAAANTSDINADSGNGNGGTTTLNGKPVQSSQAIFDEHKRRQLVRDMEEKIAIMPEQVDEAPRKKEEAVPMMSATSYPGQEWNPYGEGFEDDDE